MVRIDRDIHVFIINIIKDDSNTLIYMFMKKKRKVSIIIFQIAIAYDIGDIDYMDQQSQSDLADYTF